MDGQPATILDYSETSHLYANYRDERRQVGPGIFLGAMYSRTTSEPTFMMYFALQAPPGAGSGAIPTRSGGAPRRQRSQTPASPPLSISLAIGVRKLWQRPGILAQKTAENSHRNVFIISFK